MSHIVTALGPEGLANYEVEFEGREPKFERVHKPADRLLIPGFVDIHCHGAFGIDFMSASSEDMVDLCERLARCGYEAFLPTTVTASPGQVLAALERLPEHSLIAGFHLEGPFISPKYPGAQPPSAIADPPVGNSPWNEILDHPKLKVVTMAPELPNALDLILRLNQRGVRVSMGHTNATYEEARRGYEFGASHTTHTYNAMRPLHHREAGTVGYALANDDLACELIYDRLHVSKDAAALLLKCKPAEKVIAVSDSTMATGMGPGEQFSMWGLDVLTGRGTVTLADGNTLAGSAITLLDAFRNLAQDFGEEVAIRACCLNPRDALGWRSPPRVWIEMDRDYRIVERYELDRSTKAEI